MSERAPRPESSEQPKYVEPHDEIYEKYPDHASVNNWYTRCPGGESKHGEVIDVPLGEFYRKLSKVRAEKEGTDEATEYELNTRRYSDKRLEMTDSEFKELVADKMREAGVDVEEIRRINERGAEIAVILLEQNKLRDKLFDVRGNLKENDADKITAMRARLEEFEKLGNEAAEGRKALDMKTGVVRRMLLRDGFSHGDINA